jgi:hypothetical protein
MNSALKKPRLQRNVLRKSKIFHNLFFPPHFLKPVAFPEHLLISKRINSLRRREMTITFADGTRMDVAAAAFNDFIAHDLKWVEFVHGRATVKKPSCNQISVSSNTLKQNSAPRRGDDLCSSQCC